MPSFYAHISCGIVEGSLMSEYFWTQYWAIGTITSTVATLYNYHTVHSHITKETANI